MGIRLSVVVPTYNTSRVMLERCLASISGATNGQDEIILVDDFSQKNVDALHEVADKYSAKIIKLPQNHGQAFARNTGLSCALGEFVAFVDSDDEVLPGIYDRCLCEMALSGADIAIYGVKTKWQELGIEKINSLNDKYYGFLDAKSLKIFCDNCLFMYPWNKVYRRGFLNECKIEFEEKCIPREDEVFNLTCVLNNAKWTMVSDVGHIYYHRCGSSLGRYRRYCHESNLRVNAIWYECHKMLDLEGRTLSGFGVMSQRAIFKADWQNIWRQDSPYGMLDRWRWLKAAMNGDHVINRAIVFVMTGIRQQVRRRLYFKWMQRLHVLRLYPYAVRCC